MTVQLQLCSWLSYPEGRHRRQDLKTLLAGYDLIQTKQKKIEKLHNSSPFFLCCTHVTQIMEGRERMTSHECIP